MAVDRFLPESDFPNAIKELESSEKAFGKKNRLLYLLNMGALQHYAGNFEESNRFFQEAYDLADELYTKSITTEIAGTVSPNVRPYYGEDYERVMISTFMALNYFKLGLLEDALVEARKIDKDLELLTSKYEGKNKYKNDAFSRYLAGMIQEAGGELNDAFISYVQAYEAYREYEKMFGFRVPDQLKRDILRLAAVLRFSDKYEYFLKEFGGEYQPAGPPVRGEGEVVVIAFTGLAPLKEELSIKHTGVDDEGKTHTLELQIPVLVERPSSIDGVRVKLRAAADETGSAPEGESGEGSDKSGDTDTAASEGEVDSSTRRFRLSQHAFLAQDIVAIAKKNMDDKRPWLIMRAWTAALARLAASEKLKEKAKGESFWGNVVKGALIDSALENVTRADIRCWRTIPGRIYVSRFRLPKGSYDLCTEFLDSGGNCLSRHCNYRINVKPGRTLIYFFREFN